MRDCFAKGFEVTNVARVHPQERGAEPGKKYRDRVEKRRKRDNTR